MHSNSIEKICVLLESYYPVIGGMESQSLLLNSALASNNIKIMVITRRTYSKLKKVEIINSIRIRRINPVGYGNFKRWTMIFTSIPVLIKEVTNYNIIFVSGFRTLGISAVIISKIFRKRCILKARYIG